jgi:hypothetical protein
MTAAEIIEAYSRLAEKVGQIYDLIEVRFRYLVQFQGLDFAFFGYRKFDLEDEHLNITLDGETASITWTYRIADGEHGEFRFPARLLDADISETEKWVDKLWEQKIKLDQTRDLERADAELKLYLKLKDKFEG